MNIAVARSSNNELHFSHPLESIKFSVVSSGVKRAVLISEDGGKLAAGQLLIGFRDGKAVIQDIDNGYNTIYLTPEEGVLVPGEAYSFITIPVQSDNGLTLALEKQDGSVLYRTVFKSLMEADSGQEYTQTRMEIENTRFEVGPAGGAISINVKYHGDIHIETAGCPFVSEAGVKETEFGRFSYSYNVEPNTGAARMGVITVCDDANCYPVFINQASAEGN